MTTHASLKVIRAEHTALAAMLRSILLLLAQHRRHGTLPDFAALRAMLFTSTSFPSGAITARSPAAVPEAARAHRRWRARCSTGWTTTMRAANTTSASSNTHCWASR